MKIKKGLALILALAMIITLMPTMAFATTTNTVSRVVTVAADEEIPSATTINLETKDVWSNTTSQTIRLTLSNATWTEDPENIALEDILTVQANSSVEEVTGIEPELIAVGENYVEFSMTPEGDSLSVGDDVIITILPNSMTSGEEAGSITVDIDGMDSQVSSGTLTIATVATGTTTASVTGTVRTAPRGNVTGAAFEIRETTTNSLPDNSVQVIRLTLPRGVTWNENLVDENDDPVLPIVVGGNLAENQLTPGTPSVNDADKYQISDDGRTLTCSFTVTGSNTTRNVMTIVPNITIGRNASEGDIAISLVGTDSSATNMVADVDDLVIAAYGSETVEITTEEEIPTIVSGYTEDTKGKEFTVSVEIEESMVNSLSSGRYIDFDLPEEVQIIGPVEVKVNSSAQAVANDNSVTVEGMEGNPAVADNDDNGFQSNYAAEDTSGFEFLVPDDNDFVSNGGNQWSATRANTITFEMPVTVEAGFSGDITMSITGSRAGVEDTELVVATAEVPITVETTTTNVKNGVQTQTVADITIIENFAGYIDDENNNDEIVIDIDTLGLSQSMVFEDCDNIEVTEGNLEIGDWSITSRVTGEPAIVIPVERESTTESTITLSGLTMALNRTLPEGGYDLNVSGGAVVQNGEYNDGDFSGTAATVEDYVVITTPADDAAGVNATFTAGQASYTVDGQTVEMDVAPFIDSNNRMLVPIRYAANAMGVSDSNIQWNGYTQTGTISGAMGVVQVTVGSTNLITSNGTITMDTVAVNTNDRIYVPVRYIANALGASVEWDPATRTATFS